MTTARLRFLVGSTITAGLLAMAPASVAATGDALGKDVTSAMTLMRDVCIPATEVRAIPTSFSVPKSFSPLTEETAAPFLGRQEGEAFGDPERKDSPVVAIWKDGRCAVYLRDVKDAATTAKELAGWLDRMGLNLQGEPSTGSTPGGATVVTRNYAGSLHAPVMAILTHHSREGKPGGITLTMAPTGPVAAK